MCLAARDLPEQKIIKIGEFSIGLCHGHQVVPWGDVESLANLQRRMDVDILVTGHTHQQSVRDHEGKYMINPGSATGAYSPFTPNVVPTFVLMAIKRNKVVTFSYSLENGETVRTTKKEFVKLAAPAKTSE